MPARAHAPGVPPGRATPASVALCGDLPRDGQERSTCGESTVGRVPKQCRWANNSLTSHARRVLVDAVRCRMVG
jgi:hypothetical protein